MERTDTPTTAPEPVRSSQRFAALTGLNWTGPTADEAAAFESSIAASNRAYAALATERAPRAA